MKQIELTRGSDEILADLEQAVKVRKEALQLIRIVAKTNPHLLDDRTRGKAAMGWLGDYSISQLITAIKHIQKAESAE